MMYRVAVIKSIETVTEVNGQDVFGFYEYRTAKSSEILMASERFTAEQVAYFDPEYLQACTWANDRVAEIAAESTINEDDVQVGQYSTYIFFHLVDEDGSVVEIN